MTTVAISGADGALRSRIAEALSQIFDQVTSFTYGLDEASLTDVQCLVHLAFSDESDQRNLISLLQLANEAEVSQLVVVSSAMVYGAWPNNSVPISEDAPVRPNPESALSKSPGDHIASDRSRITECDRAYRRSVVSSGSDTHPSR